MARAMIRGLQEQSGWELMASGRSQETKKFIRDELGIREGSNRDTAAFAQILVLAVKPQFYEQVIGEIKDAVNEEAVVLSIAPGKTLAWLEERFGRPLKYVRAMPNTPAQVGAGMAGISPCERVTEQELQAVQGIFRAFGRAEIVPEHLLDVVTGVSGSAPAYVFLFIEALADAAVAGGMPRAQAYTFAAQAVMGSARMALETGLHPAQLKDMVCSPGGTTIEAVRVLEEKGFRSAVIEAVLACIEKSRGM